jgi:hypothetical protein
MIKSSGWIGEGNFPHCKEKPQEYYRIPRAFDAEVGEISPPSRRRAARRDLFSA